MKATNKTHVELKFGPDNVYSLRLPISDEKSRLALAANLTDTLLQLKNAEAAVKNTRQLHLFERLAFSE